MKILQAIWAWINRHTDRPIVVDSYVQGRFGYDHSGVDQSCIDWDAMKASCREMDRDRK